MSLSNTPLDLLRNIITYNVKPAYKLKQYIMPIYEISKPYISINPNAINFLLDNPDFIHWVSITENYNCYDIIVNNRHRLNLQSYKNLCSNTNPEIMPILGKILENKPQLIHFPTLLLNPSALDIIADNMHLIDDYYLELLIHNSNPDVIVLLEEYIENDVIDLAQIAYRPEIAPYLEEKIVNFDEYVWVDINRNPKLVHLLEEHPDKINWDIICTNKNARHIIENNLDKVNWSSLCMKSNYLDIIEKNLDKLNEQSWFELSENKDAVYILEKNIDKINFTQLSHNINGTKLIDKCLEIADYKEKEKIINKISWETICHITKDLHFLDKYNNFIDYSYLARNYNAGPIIEKYIHNFEPEDFSVLSSNPCIFEFDKIRYNSIIDSKLVQLPFYTLEDLK